MEFVSNWYTVSLLSTPTPGVRGVIGVPVLFDVDSSKQLRGKSAVPVVRHLPVYYFMKMHDNLMRTPPKLWPACSVDNRVSFFR